MEGTVACEVDDACFRMRCLRADGCAVAESHGSQSAAGDELPCVFVAQVLCRPHLVLSNVGDVNGFFISKIANRSDDFARVKLCFAALHIAGGLFPAGGQGNPFVVFLFFDKRQKLLQEVFHIGGNAQVNQYVLVDFTGVDVDLHFLGALAELFRVQCDAVAEAGAQGDHEIGPVKSLVGGNGSVHADHAQVERVVVSHDTGGHECVRSRNGSLADEFQKLFSCFGCRDTAAAVDDRTLGSVDHVGDLLQVSLGEFRHRIERHRTMRLVVDGLGRNVLGDVHEYRAFAVAVGNTEGIAQSVFQILDAVYEVGVLGNRDDNIGNADFLECIPADEAVRNVGRNGDQWGAVHESGGDTGYQIGSARAAGGKAHACLSRSAAVTVRCVGGSLFVSRHDVSDLIAIFVEGIVEIQRGAARITEDGVNAML